MFYYSRHHGYFLQRRMRNLCGNICFPQKNHILEWFQRDIFLPFYAFTDSQILSASINFPAKPVVHATSCGFFRGKIEERWNLRYLRVFTTGKLVWHLNLIFTVAYYPKWKFWSVIKVCNSFRYCNSFISWITDLQNVDRLSKASCFIISIKTGHLIVI